MIKQKLAKARIAQQRAGGETDRLKKAIDKILKDRKHILPGWSPSYLRRLGDIRTVIDIGVLKGTPSLYTAFPDAHLILVEALPQYHEIGRKIVAKHPGGGEFHGVAAGANDGEATINLLHDAPARSSLLTHVVGGSTNKSSIAVPVMRLDSLLTNRTLVRDALLKIDTEGYEINVLAGATQTLKQVDFVIAETSIRLRHENSYRFADLIGLMKTLGFDVLDFMTTTRERNGVPGASIADVVFQRADRT